MNTISINSSRNITRLLSATLGRSMRTFAPLYHQQHASVGMRSYVRSLLDQSSPPSLSSSLESKEDIIDESEELEEDHDRELRLPGTAAQQQDQQKTEEQQQNAEEAQKPKLVDQLKRQPRVAMIVAGCGPLDGVEIQEVISTTIHLGENNVDVVHCTPFGIMENIYNHASRDLDKREYRFFEKESSRIVRKRPANVQAIKPSEFDALIIPGGLVWFRNTSNLEKEHNDLFDFESNEDVNHLIKEFHAQGKPIFTISTGIGAVGIALGKHQGGPGLKRYTIGIESQFAEYLRKLGNTGDEEIDPKTSICDESVNVWSTPGTSGFANPQPEVVHNVLGGYCETILNVMAKSIGKKEE